MGGGGAVQASYTWLKWNNPNKKKNWIAKISNWKKIGGGGGGAVVPQTPKRYAFASRIIFNDTFFVFVKFLFANFQMTVEGKKAAEEKRQAAAKLEVRPEGEGGRISPSPAPAAPPPVTLAQLVRLVADVDSIASRVSVLCVLESLVWTR